MQTLTPAMRRSLLISALRHPELRPEGFQWNYAHLVTCAVGLAARMWPERVDLYTAQSPVWGFAAAIGINPIAAYAICTNQGANAKAERIADLLEATS